MVELSKSQIWIVFLGNYKSLEIIYLVIHLNGFHANVQPQELPVGPLIDKWYTPPRI